MNVYLLFPDREWASTGPYFDWSNITRDLGLNTLFKAAGADSITRTGNQGAAPGEDPYISHSVKRVMGVPLQTSGEIKYRQDIINDCFTKQAFVDRLYAISNRVLDEWEKLGRKNNSAGETNTKPKLITDIKVLKLLTDGILEVSTLFEKNKEGLSSEGFLALYDRLQSELSDERKEQLETLVDSMAFFAGLQDEKDRNSYVVKVPKIRLECGLQDGLKIGDVKVDELETLTISYNKQYGIGSKIRGRISSINPGVISLYKDQAIREDAEDIEFHTVSYVYSYCGNLVNSLGQFFDQLHFQTAFYLGVINIRSQMMQYKIDYCFPQVTDDSTLEYSELKEMILSLETKGKTVANSGNLDGKQLVIITGANQGGKSTFLRSIGTAQIMMQCGMMVPARRYKSSIHVSVFTHFTRREDSAMNSGRLDEELRRMDRIISNLGKDPLILLNESFATTTEKDGSSIAYGIVKALKEEGIRILTVTHLLSFAQQMYEESSGDDSVIFLSAEHLDDGRRTFKIIPHPPEMTSFGLELYDEILGNKHSSTDA